MEVWAIKIECRGGVEEGGDSGERFDGRLGIYSLSILTTGVSRVLVFWHGR